MMNGWGFFPWPVLFVAPMLVALVVLVVSRLSGGRAGMGPLCRRASPPAQLPAPAAVEDPLVTLRERFARGEIGMAELEARLEGLLRSDPAESMSGWDGAVPPGVDLPTRSTR